MARSIDIQSVVYTNAAKDLLRAAEAVGNAVRVARRDGLLDKWTFRLGDGSPEAMLNDDELETIESLVVAEGGAFFSDVFGANLGSAAGHNRLAAQGENEQLVILNPDALMEPRLLSEMIGTLASDIGFIEARQIPIEHPKEYDAVTGDTDWGSTACAMIPRSLFDQLSGFDAETFFLYCDDVDFSWRVRLAGKRVVYQPSARLFHDKRLTKEGDWPSSNAERYYSAEAALMLAYKYSREDVLRKNSRIFRNSGDPNLLKALREFESRRSAGTLPEQIDRDRRVAKFVSGNYAAHRY